MKIYAVSKLKKRGRKVRASVATVSKVCSNILIIISSKTENICTFQILIEKAEPKSMSFCCYRF